MRHPGIKSGAIFFNSLIGTITFEPVRATSVGFATAILIPLSLSPDVAAMHGRANRQKSKTLLILFIELPSDAAHKTFFCGCRIPNQQEHQYHSNQGDKSGEDQHPIKRTCR